MQTIQNAQARGTIESQVPPAELASYAAGFVGAIEDAISQTVSDDMLMAYGMLGAPRPLLVKHLAERALQEYLDAE